MSENPYIVVHQKSINPVFRGYGYENGTTIGNQYQSEYNIPDNEVTISRDKYGHVSVIRKMHPHYLKKGNNSEIEVDNMIDRKYYSF